MSGASFFDRADRAALVVTRRRSFAPATAAAFGARRLVFIAPPMFCPGGLLTIAPVADAC
jgi:hypothetical protein